MALDRDEFDEVFGISNDDSDSGDPAHDFYEDDEYEDQDEDQDEDSEYSSCQSSNSDTQSMSSSVQKKAEQEQAYLEGNNTNSQLLNGKNAHGSINDFQCGAQEKITSEKNDFIDYYKSIFRIH